VCAVSKDMMLIGQVNHELNSNGLKHNYEDVGLYDIYVYMHAFVD
jgi:hypothetical protein